MFRHTLVIFLERFEAFLLIKPNRVSPKTESIQECFGWDSVWLDRFSTSRVTAELTGGEQADLFDDLSEEELHVLAQAISATLSAEIDAATAEMASPPSSRRIPPATHDLDG